MSFDECSLTLKTNARVVRAFEEKAMAKNARRGRRKLIKNEGKPILGIAARRRKSMSSNSDTEEARRLAIRLEVTNVRLLKTSVEIQVKGDRADREPVWWVVDSSAVSGAADNGAIYRTIAEGLDKKRIMIAELRSDSGSLKCIALRIQYAESTPR